MYFLFFSGAAYYILKERIRLSHPFFWFCVICLIFAKGQAFLNVYTLTSSYVLLYLAYIPAGFLRKYNQLGDYSYGVYIYAFLVQQSVVALIPKASVCLMNLISIPVTLCLAMLSWYFIERGALSLKGTFVGSTKKILDNFL
jgi:peptidoglycan/LPS O-acetylase OafA/YrhL